ncbi:tetratricopeptide repeat protein [Chelativorans intermedius]|uniref:tetratricopeptide repeat protein n=1 Tax=Chelativorans intermedius TaxID=515947 RepID=UPI003670D4D6
MRPAGCDAPGGIEIRRQKPVLAVLPFKVVSGGQSDGTIADGLVEDLSDALARFSTLESIAPMSGAVVAELADREAARRLGATHLLRGRLQREGERFRLVAGLVDGESGAQLWSEKLEAPATGLFELQGELVARISATFSARIEETALQAARRKPTGSLAAYELTLKGMSLLRRGSYEADEEARGLFRHALELDPQYARAYAGLSLSWFNEWGCQLWNRIAENGQAAYEYAHRALDLDDSDAMLHVVIGRILLYRREYEQASWYLDRALQICPNDADVLLQLAVAEVFLGRPEIGIERGAQALHLNPYHPNGCYAYAAFPYFTARKLEDFLKLNGRAVNTPLICAPAHSAISSAYLGRMGEAQHHLKLFYEKFGRMIADGRPFTPREACDWLLDYAPYRRREDREFVADGFRLVDGGIAKRSPETTASHMPTDNIFVSGGGGWRLRFAGREANLPDIKGLRDIQRLIGRAGEEIHCLDLAGREEEAYGGQFILDDKARQSLKLRIRDLQEEIAEAEDMNDPGRAERAREELDQLVEMLSKALGLGGRNRQLGSMSERARTAVTWRIRHAIRKIETLHPDLARHLRTSVRTGTFCAYRPEQPIRWRLCTD